MTHCSKSQLNIYLRPFVANKVTKDTAIKVLKLHQFIDQIDFQNRVETKFRINPLLLNYTITIAQYIDDNNFESLQWLENILEEAKKNKVDYSKKYWNQFDEFYVEYSSTLLFFLFLVSFLGVGIMIGNNVSRNKIDGKVYSDENNAISEFINNHDGVNGEPSESLSIVPIDSNKLPLKEDCRPTSNQQDPCYNTNFKVQLNTTSNTPVSLQLEFKTDSNPIQIIELTPKPNPDYANTKSTGYQSSVILPRDLISAKVIKNSSVK